MLHVVSNALLEFSKSYNLWQAAKESGLRCLGNWMNDCPDEYAQLCLKSISAEFRLEEHSQHIIFSQYGSEAFIIRTKYSLLISSQQGDYIDVGWCALDVNQEGEHVDDWLVIR
jgi:hypothetical protein